jgi:hypothetical protein
VLDGCCTLINLRWFWQAEIKRNEEKAPIDIAMQVRSPRQTSDTCQLSFFSHLHGVYALAGICC